MRIFIESQIERIATVAGQTKWARTHVNRYYNSAKEAKKHHNLANCNYQHIDDDGNVVAQYSNALIDAYGRRYR